ncbi:MAG TPA: acyl-ACP--UDP-N-acetylglucosamine O-acyltransferase [Phycisphaerae bacterium]|jgi:UDP-N-acetylglucosamine acyltransferase|nr:acyl-ACP--UDP-N-acetylglucosamine O-acyltransferase [Phycisphaerae bacterium]HOB75971.1 acyl-ACP--UDP-N-acetylglucosamine O-acyltransferase [Phycisphaerae bacterium]HOJ55844.1 acyl-ACP--UDP-N-acetylglucosamine O-acyltransferase [Phycisphaerae bacterium]HOL27817.1 acyl-ACP--UDP-N-acetylglucosamine O-acyltransferase [Phycisphaerae bacterium]HPP22254.1 acyl-ACP--UDP-N-acetylglucosamine O-acyltransferase [Phycisphaerae bacterium]
MIHPSAYVDPKAELGRNISIGPFSYVGAGVVLGDDCVLHNNATVTGNTVCGRANVFFPGTVVGVVPQDLKYKGGPTRLEIGDDNVFREYVTVHAGTEVGGGVTRVGSHNRFLVGVHIAHDVIIGDDCIVSNYTQVAGHARLEDKVTMGGMIGIHHFVTIGTMAYVGAMARVGTDVPPFMVVEGNPAEVRGFNKKGMQRWGYSEAQIRAVQEAWKVLYSSKAREHGNSILERLAVLEGRPELNGEVRYLCASIRRTLQDGVFGRYLEALRKDSDADRRAYYGGEG